jgi:hypothetical protein
MGRGKYMPSLTAEQRGEVEALIDQRRGWFSSPQMIAAIIAAVVSLIGGALGAAAIIKPAEERLGLEFKLQFAAERVARELMEEPTFRFRSFEVIKYHLGGFKDDELRQILVRAGAVRFETANGTEWWGLMDRVSNCLGMKPLVEIPNTNRAEDCGPSK